MRRSGMLPSAEESVSTEEFKAEVHEWAREIGVVPKEIQFRAMKRKWASCSSLGRLTFNRALLSQPAEFRAEVIVHELLHLKIPNHGALFRSLLRAYLGRRSIALPR
ncbi:MAG: M48 family metallopeptidase [Firmicutes bacterium]|nr:M48 family metallopeptidase [Bacillota bacterium]